MNSIATAMKFLSFDSGAGIATPENAPGFVVNTAGHIPASLANPVVRAMRTKFSEVKRHCHGLQATRLMQKVFGTTRRPMETLGRFASGLQAARGRGKRILDLVQLFDSTARLTNVAARNLTPHSHILKGYFLLCAQRNL